MRYFIIAGEASGDLHGGGLVRALQTHDPDAEIACWGGEHMATAGAVLLKHYRDLAFMGFIEVLFNIITILRNFRLAKSQIQDFAPDALVLIDYPGFNLRMAKWAHARGIPVYYYISPQLWAWKENRVKAIRAYVSHMYVILPFEKAFYAGHDIEVTYVGHPLLEAIARYQAKPLPQTQKPIIAILAGSRVQEVRQMLPVMLEVAEGFPAYQFYVAAARHVQEDIYLSLIGKSHASNVAILRDRTYDILSNSVAALTTSGTATLETALFDVPQVVCYKGNRLSYQIARRLVKVPFISLVNLIAGKAVVEELIQQLMTSTRLSRSLSSIIEGPVRKEIRDGYQLIRQQLDEGGASNLVASHMTKHLKNDGNI